MAFAVSGPTPVDGVDGIVATIQLVEPGGQEVVSFAFADMARATKAGNDLRSIVVAAADVRLLKAW